MTVDAPSVFRQLRAALSGGRTLFGKKIHNLKGLFKVLDKDKGGTVSHDEFKAGLHRLDIGLTKDQVRALLNVVDDDHSGGIDINEFLRAAREFSPTRIRKRKNATNEDRDSGVASPGDVVESKDESVNAGTNNSLQIKTLRKLSETV